MARLLTVVAGLLVAGAASAHPDHASGGDFGLTHLLTDPFHLSLLAGAVVLFFAARRAVLRRHALRRERH